MALIQTRKESIHFHHDKENSSNHANITTKKSNFLIKKCAKATIKPILKSLIQPTLDYLDTQIFNNGKLHVVNQHVQDPALTRKINANKVKKSLNFDKETYYLKKGHGDWLSHKDKAGIPPKGRFSNIDGVLVKQEEGRGSYPNIESLLNGKDASEMAHEEYEHGLGKVLEQVHIAKEHVEERAVDFKKQANKMVRLYAGDIIQTLKEKDESSRIINCLSRHKITPALRTKMVDWMIEVMCSYKCMDSTFFLAISIMDDFFLKSEVVQSGNDLHLIGVTSMFIASKYEEIYPMRLAVVYDKVAHKKLIPEEITKKEGEMLQALGFNLTFATIYEFITNVIFQLNLEETMTAELYAYLHKVCLYLAKADLHDYDLMNQYNNCQLAAGTLFVAFKVIEQLDSNFPLINLITQVCEILKVDEEVLYHCASKILCLAKNFEKVYANYKNLKKFHFLGAPGEMSGPCGAHNIGNKFSTTR